MSIVLKDIDLEITEEVDSENLEPVSDEELAEIIEEVGNAIVAEIEENYEARELLPEEEEILAAETFEERTRLYNKYYHILFPED